MLRLKKYVRNIIKTLLVLAFLGVLYTVQFSRVENHHVLRKDEILFNKEKVPSDVVDESKKQIREIEVEEPENPENAVIKTEKPVKKLDKPVKKLDEPVNKPLLDDITFEERDMYDENGKPFQIAIWMNHGGKPGYLANPKECLGNVSCDIIYASSSPLTAHAIVFKADHMGLAPPTPRKPHQLYAWWTLESPLNTPIPSSRMDGIFNLTFHYRTDADVYAPYGSINLILRELKKAGETNLDELLAKKRNSNKIAAWAVSNCYSKRMAYARSLIKAELSVDTFGSCWGGRQIGRGKYSDSFYEELSNYKFYFSFENSITCKDYFTEKFWFNGLRSGAVPIVWGPSKEDLLKVAPTKSFIHADDFSSPNELVKYLNYLVSNETAYAEYLQWRTWVEHPERIEERLQMKNRDNDLRSYCKLCSIIQSNARKRRLGLPVPVRSYHSMKAAWMDPEQGKCHT